MDPSVYVQPLPVRRPEGAVKPKPARRLSGAAGDAPKMRPTPEDDKPDPIQPKKRTTKDAASTAALDSGAQTSEPLALRPPVTDSQATLEASARR